MEQQRLGEGRDRRQSPLFKRNGDLDTSMLYKTLKTPFQSRSLGKIRLEQQRRLLELNSLHGSYLREDSMQDESDKEGECGKHGVRRLSCGGGDADACDLWLLSSETILGGGPNSD